MGFLTLLARKIHPDKRSQVRAPTYECKISPKSPVRRLQTVSPSGPVPHNHDSYETPRPRSRHIDTRQYPSSPPSEAPSPVDSAAPAPVILGFRGDDVPSRPNTSFSKPEADARRIGALSGLPTISSRPPSRLSQLMRSRSRTSLVRSPRPVTAEASSIGQSIHKPQSSRSSSRLAQSIRSEGGGGKSYVDLLDAQSEFKPSDFRSRVKATGARDYGEDVADRNIGVNGCDLDSQPVRAFYAVKPRASSRVASAEQRRPLYSLGPLPDYSDSEDDTAYYPHVLKQSSIDSALWSKALNSLNPVFHGDAESQFVLNAAALQRSRTLHRQTYNALQSESAISSFGARPSTSACTSRQSHASQRAGTGLSSFRQNEDAPRLANNDQPDFSPQPTSFQLSASLADSASTSSSKHPPAMQNMHPAQHLLGPPLELHSTTPDMTSFIYQVNETAHSFNGDWQDEFSDRESAPSPFIKRSRSRSRSRDLARDHYRANDTATPQPQLQPGETDTLTPGRANTNRHWSMSSTTPTTSSSSSAAYGRPYSRHTANTSIDFSTDPPSSTTLGSGLTHSRRGSVKKMQSFDQDAKQTPAVLQSLQYEVDDDVSSDDDSFIGGQRERSACEEDLLFGSGYGKNGMQLPGLQDAFSAPTPITRARNPRDNRRQSLSEPPLMANFALRPMASDDSLDLDSIRIRRKRPTGDVESVLMKSVSREELASQFQGSPARRSETKRMSALLEMTTTTEPLHKSDGEAFDIDSLLFHSSSSPHLIHCNDVGEQMSEKEDPETVDVATAVRLRKENKARKRASVMSIASQGRSHNLVKTTTPEGQKTRNGLENDEPLQSHVPSFVRVAGEDHDHAVESDDEQGPF